MPKRIAALKFTNYIKIFSRLTLTTKLDLKAFLMWFCLDPQQNNTVFQCNSKNRIMLQPTKDKGRATTTPLGCHVITMGWFTPIVELLGGQGKLKNCAISTEYRGLSLG